MQQASRKRSLTDYQEEKGKKSVKSSPLKQTISVMQQQQQKTKSTPGQSRKQQSQLITALEIALTFMDNTCQKNKDKRLITMDENKKKLQNEIMDLSKDNQLTNFILTFKVDGYKNLITFANLERTLQYYPLVYKVVYKCLEKNVDMLAFKKRRLLSELDLFSGIDKSFETFDSNYYDKVWDRNGFAQQREEESHIRKIDLLLNYVLTLEKQTKGSSDTIIYKGSVENKNFYVKAYDLENVGLIYEKEVLRYIRAKAQSDVNIRKHFIDMLLCIKDDGEKRGYIFTEDRGAQTLTDFNHNNKQILENIFFQYLYVIYLMKTTLNIVHQDLHTGNVLVEDDEINNKVYNMYGKKYKLPNHPYSVCVYDFDQSSIVAQQKSFFKKKHIHALRIKNPFTQQAFCKTLHRCSDPSTDVYNWFIMLMNSNNNKIKSQKINDFIIFCNENNLLPPESYRIIENNSGKGYNSWYNLCVGSKINECNPPKLDIKTFIDPYYNIVIKNRPH